MGSFEVHVRIGASAGEVWKVLADIGNIHLWNPGVVSSHTTKDQVTGVGAGRFCDLGRENYLDEEVVEWEEGECLTMRIIGTNLPFKAADIRFRLRADDSVTVVTVSPDYELKFGVLGKLLDLIFVRRSYEKGMRELLGGLKE